MEPRWGVGRRQVGVYREEEWNDGSFFYDHAKLSFNDYLEMVGLMSVSQQKLSRQKDLPRQTPCYAKAISIVVICA